MPYSPRVADNPSEGIVLDEARAEPLGTLRIEKLRLANSVQRSMNYSLTPNGVSIETATRIL